MERISMVTDHSFGIKGTIDDAVYRLSAIEDILGDDYDLDRLELVKADKEGRCVVLPCKEGDLVYWALNGNLYKTSFRLSALKYFGKYVFDTREAAEAALAKEADHE